MKILFISNDLLAGNLAYVLKKQGNEVKLFIENKQQRENFDNLVEKTDNWKKELPWVGKDGLIIFDTVDYGEDQDKLRNNGYSVFGGSKLGDRLENDRAWAQSIFRKYGLDALPTYDFTSINKAIAFVTEHPDTWVIKQNGESSKSLNYIGNYTDGRDVISVLSLYKRLYDDVGIITLQKRAIGVEIGVGRFFNGKDWVGPIEINIEHKKMFPGDLGPSTGEMGTVAWYDNNEKNKLFKRTLEKLKPFLIEINYKGDIDIGCIVNKNNIYPLEVSARFGSPIIHLQCDLHISPWADFLKAIADGKNYKLRWKKGFGVVVMISTPPFPYVKKLKDISSYHSDIHFDFGINEKHFGKNVHFEEVSFDPRNNRYYISDHRGYVMYVTSIAKSVNLAAKKVYKLIRMIHLPQMFYRNDIGKKFEEVEIHKLKKWGYM